MRVLHQTLLVSSLCTVVYELICASLPIFSRLRHLNIRCQEYRVSFFVEVHSYVRTMTKVVLDRDILRRLAAILIALSEVGGFTGKDTSPEMSVLVKKEAMTPCDVRRGKTPDKITWSENNAEPGPFYNSTYALGIFLMIQAEFPTEFVSLR